MEVEKLLEPVNELRMQWFNPATGKYTEPRLTTVPQREITVKPPTGWADAVLILRH